MEGRRMGHGPQPGLIHGDRGKGLMLQLVAGTAPSSLSLLNEDPYGNSMQRQQEDRPSQRDAPWYRGDPAAPMATPELLRDTAEEAPPEQLALLSHHRWGGQNPTSTQNAPNPCAGQGPLLDVAPSWLQCHSHRVTASTECWGQGLTPSQHPVSPPATSRSLWGHAIFTGGDPGFAPLT